MRVCVSARMSETTREREREGRTGRQRMTQTNTESGREREREIVTWRERMREILRESKTESFLEVEIVRQI